MSMYIGEALVGEGNEVAHIDLLIGSKNGPVGEAFAQTGQLAPIPTPLPFPQGSSVFQWDYECIGQKGCGFSGFGLERLTLRSASIVLARFKVGESKCRLILSGAR